MNIINMLKNVAFMVDPGPDENSELWKMLQAYDEALSNEQDTSSVCTLEAVLESKDVLSFLQHNHQPLVNFLTTKENIQKILQYVTSCPESKSILAQRSCKILCHNSAAVREVVFSDASSNFDILFGFENEDQLQSSTLANLDPMHSGLLTQVIQKFLNTHNWYTVEYLSSKDAFIEKPEQLLSSPGLLQTLVDTNYCYSGSALGQWLESIRIVDILVSAFKGQQGDAAVTCAGEILRTIIQSVSPLLPQLESREVISQLLTDAFHSENPSSLEAKMEISSVCRVLCQKYNNEAYERIPDPLVPILDHLEDFNAILAPTDNAELLVNTSGSVVPFGMRRMQVVELYSSLLCVGSTEINQIMLDKGVFQNLLNAFFLYKWNNILQTSVMAMFDVIFRTERRDFCKQVLEKTDLIPKVSFLLAEDLKREQAGEPVSPYRGFLRGFSTIFFNLSGIAELTPVFDSYEEWRKLLETISQRNENNAPVTNDGENMETLQENNSASEKSMEEEKACEPAFTGVVVEKNIDQMEVDVAGVQESDTMESESKETVESEPVQLKASEDIVHDSEPKEAEDSKVTE